jgi:hypothetical protein
MVGNLNNMKKFLLKILLFSAALVVFYLPFVLGSYCSFPEMKAVQKSLRHDTDVIVFGSSVNQSCADGDTDRRSISQMIDSFLDDIDVAGISHAAYHLDVYAEYISYIAQTGKKPIVIIPINLRSFSPEWDLRPNYQFIRERSLLNPFASIRFNGVPFLGFSMYPWTGSSELKSISMDEYYETPVFHSTRCVGKVADYDFTSGSVSDGNYDGDSEMLKGFVYHYMQPLHQNHRKLISLSRICGIGNDHGLTVVTYITPIDYQSAEKMGIEGFSGFQRQNIEIIQSVMMRHGSAAIDLSMALDSSHFDYEYRPCEHLNMMGREAVARELAAAISRVQGASQD